LLITRLERLDVEVREQPLNVRVRKLAALDARGRANALNRRDTAQDGKPLRPERAKRTPGSFELVDLGDEGQYIGGNQQGISLKAYTRKYPIRSSSLASFVLRTSLTPHPVKPVNQRQHHGRRPPA